VRTLRVTRRRAARRDPQVPPEGETAVPGGTEDTTDATLARIDAVLDER
jgi:hypothetical protein